VIVLAWRSHSHAIWPLDLKVLRRLVALGLPISLLPIAFTFFQSLDRWVVAAFVPSADLGYYGLGATLGMFLYLLPNTLAMVLFTKQIAEFGASGDAGRNASLVLAPIQVSGYIMALVAGGMVLAMPFIIHYLTPRYAPALGVATLQVVGNCLLFVVPVGSNFLISVNRQKMLTVALGLAMLGEAALVAALVQTPLGIDGAAWAVLLSDGLYSAAVAWLCLSLFGANRLARIGRIATYFVPFALCVPVALVLQRTTSLSGSLLADSVRLLAQGTAYLIVAGAASVGAAKLTGLLAEPFVAVRLAARLPASISSALLGKR
jgi:O-antigen/teichoic acid export membrane protein